MAENIFPVLTQPWLETVTMVRLNPTASLKKEGGRHFRASRSSGAGWVTPPFPVSSSFGLRYFVLRRRRLGFRRGDEGEEVFGSGSVSFFLSLFMASADIEYRCFVGGLAWATDDRGLEEAFSSFGEVIESKVVSDRETGRSRGFGFVTFREEQAMRDAIEGMNGKDLHGRNITVNEAQPRGGNGGGGGGGGGFRSGNGGGGYGRRGGGNGGYGGGGYGGGSRRSEGGGYGSRGGGGRYGGSEGGDRYPRGGGASDGNWRN